MTVRVGINGFGRIGRQSLRTMLERHPDTLQVTAINDIADIATNAHLFRHDSNYGRFPGRVDARDGELRINDWTVRVFSEREPAAIPWKDAGVDLVVESTGRFTQAEKARGHLQGGAKKVILSAPGKGDDITVNMGVNHELYDPKKHVIVSNGSCTTNALSVTAKAIFLVLPELQGKMHGIALRVPTATVSIVDLVCELEKPASAQDINAAYKRYSEEEMAGFLGYSEEELVSMDYKQSPFSGVVDAALTTVLTDNFVKVMSWYDNEWGYACRVADLAHYMAQRGL